MPSFRSALAGFAFITLLTASVTHAEQVVFSEVMYHPLDGKPEFIEVQNQTSNRMDMAQWKVTGGITMTLPAFNAGDPAAHFLKEYERILLSSATEAATRLAYPNIPPTVRIFGPWTGLLKNSGDAFVLSDAASAKLCALEYGDNGKWPVAADGAGHSLVVINANRAIDDWRNWKLSTSRGGSPGTAEPTSTEEPVGSPEVAVGTTTNVVDFNGNTGAANPSDTQWKFYNQVTAPPANWKDANFVDTSWSGPGYAPLGNETAGAPFPGIRTNVPQMANLMTYYFRTTFNWTGPATGNSFSIDQYIDDGVVLYLNGQEIGRDRMLAGLVDHTTPANGGNAAPDATFETGRMTGSSSALDGLLVAGVNTLAAEVHQNAAGSSDHVFAIRMKLSNTAPSGLRLNEIKPGGAGNGFVEFYNPTAAAIDLQGYYLSDAPLNLTKFQIATSVIVPAGGFATVGFAESNLAVTSPVVVYLTRPDGTTRQGAISAAMSTTDGRSIGRKPAGSSQWYLFSRPTPGAPNEPFSLRLNEVHFGADGHVDSIEFANPTNQAASGTGFFVSSNATFSNGIALPATVAANGFSSLAVDFTPNNSGEIVLYVTDNLYNVVETVELARRAGLPFVQRQESNWFNSPTGTPNAANVPAKHDEIVINEIMFKLPSSHDIGQFIELTNNSAGSVNLSGWRFTEGVDYAFPSGTTLAAGQRLVVAKNPAYITTHYGAVANLYGPFSGSLKGGGELIVLEDERFNVADAVDYKTGGQWPGGTSGEGSSLELLHPSMDNSLPSSWRGSDESNKTTFQSYSHTGIYRELRGTPEALTSTRELLLNLVSDGHVVLKNLKLTTASAPTTNQIVGGDATSHGTGTSVNGWLCTGTHCLSDTLADGFHLISAGSGDTKANKAEVDVIGIVPNENLTLTFDARWVSGLPLMVAQTWDRSFGKVFRFPVPNNLGTPGAANSIAIANAAPTVDHMAHAPVVPTSTQPVVVTARVSSVAILTAVNLIERIDSVGGNNAWNSVAMNDAGTNGDSTAGDGIWSATVAARPDGTITLFYISATSSNGTANECPRSGSQKPGMWIVDNSPPAADPGLLVERNIISLYHRNALNSGTGFSSAYDWDHPRMSNFGFNATIIMNETDVLYNCELRRGGSPWTRTGANTLDRSRWKPPGDNVFRDRSKNGIDNDAAGGNRFHNRMTRYMLHLLGYPVPQAEFVQQIVNADGPRLGDSQEQTDSDFFNRAYEDGTDGELFEIDDSWFMYDSNNMDNRLNAGDVTARWSLLDWNNSTAATPSEESPIFFHGNWPIRFPEDRYDYAALSSFIKTAFNSGTDIGLFSQSQQDAWREQMERQIDINRAAMYAAVRGYVYDWDNFTGNRGKNGYFYRRPTDGKFEFHHWDSDLAFQDANNIVIGGAGGTGWTNLANRPYFRRAFNFYLSELLSKYTKNSPRMNAYLDAINYQSANANGLAPFKTAGFSYPNWFTSRESRIITEINSQAGGNNSTRAYSISTPNNQTVTNPRFTLSGEAPSAIWSVDVLGHPEAKFNWSVTTSNLTLWTLSEIALANGVNALTVRFLDRDGIVLNSLPLNVTLTPNAPPVVQLTSDPASMRVAANEMITFDATGSFDPEATTLGYAWNVSPLTGVTISQPTLGLMQAVFTIPGIYTMALTVTDGANLTTTVNREITVTNANDFHAFSSSAAIDPAITLQNVGVRNSFSPNAWYSIEDITGRLIIQVLDTAARPLANPTFSYPLVTRDVPDSSNFTLQSEVDLLTREFGNFTTGLWLETTESGFTVKYAFGLSGGTSLVVSRAIGNGAFGVLNTTAHTGSGATLRIRRVGNQLLFQRFLSNAWSTLYTQNMPSGAIGGRGGVFVATPLATNVQVAFDYLLVADPANTNSVLSSLRISEVMYNPQPGGIEYIELGNFGPQPINLNGVNFVAGKPFAAFVFGNETLNPGEFICVTENIPGFQAAYGNGIRLAGAWASGSLNNGGEEIILQDANSNVIHQFTYGDSTAPGWPTTPDGTGPSLEVLNVNGDYNDGSNWRASGESLGSPGVLGLGPDSDSDGLPDSIEARFGTDPNNPGSTANASATLSTNGEINLAWPTLNGRSYRIERSSDLVQWNPLQTIVASGSTAQYTDTQAPANQRFYYRIVPLP